MTREPPQPPTPDGASRADASDEPLWLIDGFNVLHVGGLRRAAAAETDDDESQGWWTASPRGRVIERARDFDEAEARIVVVFDGDRPATGPDELGDPRLEVVFAPSADDWIRRRARDLAAEREVVVVTADRQLGGRVRHHGARVVAPRDWLARCRPRGPGDG